jgi:hypothetical protein
MGLLLLCFASYEVPLTYVALYDIIICNSLTYIKAILILAEKLSSGKQSEMEENLP